MSTRSNLARTATRFLGDVLRESLKQSGRRRPNSRRNDRARSAGSRSTGPHHEPHSGAQPASDYPGDFTGAPDLSYSPKPDGKPDPGEIVWGWVPFEEDHSQARTGRCCSWDATATGCSA